MTTATFSCIKQSTALGCFPRLKIVHTSRKFMGQIYIPVMNWFLLVVCLAFVAIFGSINEIGNAYGVTRSSFFLPCDPPSFSLSLCRSPHIVFFSFSISFISLIIFFCLLFSLFLSVSDSFFSASMLSVYILCLSFYPLSLSFSFFFFSCSLFILSLCHSRFFFFLVLSFYSLSVSFSFFLFSDFLSYLPSFSFSLFFNYLFIHSLFVLSFTISSHSPFSFSFSVCLSPFLLISFFYLVSALPPSLFPFFLSFSFAFFVHSFALSLLALSLFFSLNS